MVWSRLRHRSSELGVSEATEEATDAAPLTFDPFVQPGCASALDNSSRRRASW